jgi:hypothetical protein
MARLEVETSRLMSIFPALAPELKKTKREYCPDELSGLYHTQIELDGPVVIEGIEKNCLCVFVLALPKPPGCAKFTTFCRSVKLPGIDAGLPVAVSDPVTPEASARNALGWNG